MIRIYLFMMLLGLAAIDPIGIAAMPVLLIQKRPLLRSLTFLGGSFASLVLMGVVFALGLGTRVLTLEHTYRWLVPGAELLAAALLCSVAGVMLYRAAFRVSHDEPPVRIMSQLHLGVWHVCVTGAMLVAVQSCADVVFAIAMVRVGQLHASFPVQLGAIGVYAIAALALQLLVIGVYVATPQMYKAAAVHKVRVYMTRYTTQATIAVSALLGCVLGVYGLMTLLSRGYL